MSAAPTIAAIKQAVAAEFGLSLAELDSFRRSRRQTVPRHIAIWLAMELTRNPTTRRSCTPPAVRGN